MPVWAGGPPYEFISARPCERWDDKNRLFHADTSVAQFVLVFRQSYSDEEQPGHFLVFLGFDMNDQAERAKTTSEKIWCNTQFHRGLDLGALDVGHPVEERSRYSHSIQGAGVILKCYTSVVAVSGQQLFCADIHVRAL